MDIHLETFKRIADDDIRAYEILFKEYYKFLCSYAYGITKDKHAAEEIVEIFFIELWNNRQKIKINTSVRSYFVSSIHNRCLNYLQRNKHRFVSIYEVSKFMESENSFGDQLIEPEQPSLLINELETIVAKAIEKLPSSCKEIFLLSRFKEHSYDEIADKLSISVNTVKTQIKIALRKLREDLRDYLHFLLLFF